MTSPRFDEVILTPREWKVLLACPPKESCGARGKDITRLLTGRTDAPAVDRTIATLKSLSEKGLVQGLRNLYSFTQYFRGGYRLTEAGEALVERHLMEGAA